jgi:hypothetical protein
MDQSDIFNLGLIGILLLSVPALIAGVFPFVEKTIKLVSDTLFLRSFKGVIFWVIIFGIILYVAGNEFIVRLTQYIR